jgi:hypothetical protein
MVPHPPIWRNRLGPGHQPTLVEAMGGEINFYSLGEGLGSTVTFTVPLYRKPLLSGIRTQRRSLLNPPEIDLRMRIPP